MNVIFTAWTVAVCIVFCAIAVWAWSPGRREEFEDAARLALDELPEDKHHG